MHERLDQLAHWLNELRAELPPRDVTDTTEVPPTDVLPLVNLGTAISKLRKTPDLTPPQVPGVSPGVPVITDPVDPAMSKILAQERLDKWAEDIAQHNSDSESNVRCIRFRVVP